MNKSPNLLINTDQVVSGKWVRVVSLLVSVGECIIVCLVDPKTPKIGY
jgi:hypothetical protein